jgi:hypothetical protein
MSATTECVILVDNSNLFIEGQKVSAWQKGQRETGPNDRQPNDVSWRIDFANLLKELADGRTIREAILVVSAAQ